MDSASCDTVCAGSQPQHHAHRLRLHHVAPMAGSAMQVAAYLLDHAHFSGVPPTALVSCKQDQGAQGMYGTEVKVGSLQAFVGSDSDCEERGPHAFPTSEVAPSLTLLWRSVHTEHAAADTTHPVPREIAGSWRLRQIMGSSSCTSPPCSSIPCCCLLLLLSAKIADSSSR